MDKKRYIGITIGPIFETMSLTSSPAALWTASYMFSLLSRCLCEVLTEYECYGVSEKDIISPFYEKAEPLLSRNDGVGLFHDRIIFIANGFDIKKQFTQVRDEAVSRVAQALAIDFDELRKYIMVSAVEFESDSPLIDSGKIFDSIELAKPFVAQERENPILALFTGDENSKNSAVKEIPAITSLSQFQLRAENSKGLKDIESIVSTCKGFKKSNYYALVRSDADNMGAVIGLLDNDTDRRSFSKECLAYCADVADAVKTYGGVTVYSGGDDLLAILPCESVETETIFGFLVKANEVFSKHFGAESELGKKLEEAKKKKSDASEQKSPSLSFGITIAYRKFPLYEALDDSAALLFGVAKKDTKNRVAIRLQKHSGQSEGLVVSNDELGYIKSMLDDIIKEKESKKTDDKIFLSALHKLAWFEKSFDNAQEKAEIENLFKNTFDGPEHKDNTFLLVKLPELLLKLREGAGIYPLDNNGIAYDKPSMTMQYVLRMFKFFVEKASAEDKQREDK